MFSRRTPANEVSYPEGL